MNTFVAVVPARGGSRGIPGKNIRELAGQPLIAYTILDSIRTKQIERTFVSTDSTEIADIALKYGADVPFLRPSQFARHDSPDLEWALHFLEWYKEAYMVYPQYIVHLRATTPFREIKLIEQAIDMIQKYPECSSLISLEENTTEVWKNFLIKEEPYIEPLFKWENNLLPRQSFPPVYHPNGYVDILKSETLLKNEFHGKKILGFVTPKIVELDNESDWELAEYVASKII